MTHGMQVRTYLASHDKGSGSLGLWSIASSTHWKGLNEVELGVGSIYVASQESGDVMRKNSRRRKAAK
jgi:hypothetical protein